MIVFVGMDGVDKERVQRIVYEMSKGSKYFENEEKKEASMKEKIEYMRSQCEKLTAKDLSHFQKVGICMHCHANFCLVVTSLYWLRIGNLLSTCCRI